MNIDKASVIAEKAALDEKLAELKAFCFTFDKVFRALDPIDRDLLEDQFTAMNQYSHILGRRIHRL